MAQRHEEVRDTQALMEKVPELFVVDLVSESELEMEMEYSESNFYIPPLISILLALLPPSLTTSRMSVPQRSHQIFPYNMSPSHSLTVYCTTLFLSLIFFYQQDRLFNIFYPIHPHSVAERLFYATAILNEVFYIYFAVYPIVYAVVLRIEEGEWPSSLRVWGSERMRRGERERGAEREDMWVASVGWKGIWRALSGYTFYGDLGKRERLPDLEDAEGFGVGQD